MPITPTYPGVYIEEIPSGAHSIAGVATSICAFVGPTKQGPVNEPTTVFNYGEFDRRFGGLSLSSPLSFAVRDFFQNGGGQAIIVRVVHDGNDAAGDKDGSKKAATAATFDVTDGEATPPTLFTLAAANPGSWANTLRVEVQVPALGTDANQVAAATDVAEAQGVDATDIMHVTVTDSAKVPLETFLNVTVVEGPRRLDKVLENNSRLIRFQGSITGVTTPTQASETVEKATKEGEDGSVPEDHHLVTDTTKKGGIQALEKADLFNLLVIPPTQLGASGDISEGVWKDSAKYCNDKRAILLVDAPDSSGFGYDKALQPTTSPSPVTSVGSDDAKNTAFYFPRLMQANPLHDGQLEEFAPCGAIAGVIARTDSTRGVWKAPAGIEAGLGVPKLAIKLTDMENGQLNQLGVNCLRSFATPGRVVWGSRTRKGADALASEWKYLPVRRTALYIEESLFRGLQWVVFEPNDEPLWAQIRLNVGAFMNRLFKQGAFQGQKPKEAYLVKCDSETTTQDDIDRGIVNILVAFAPLKPAEFVILKIQQLAGQSAA